MLYCPPTRASRQSDLIFQPTGLSALLNAAFCESIQHAKHLFQVVLAVLDVGQARQVLGKVDIVVGGFQQHAA